jgi:hypothetical protein
MEAWWVALGLQVIGAVSNVVTFWRVDLADLYSKMGYDSRTAAIATQILAHPAMRWMTIISILPWLVWLFCIRRYFGTPTATPPLIEANQPG